MKKKILLISLFLVMFMSFSLVGYADTYDCYYEYNQGKDKTILGYNLGGDVTVIQFKGTKVNKTVSSNAGSYSTDKCYPYISVAREKKKQMPYEYTQYKLGESGNDVKFSSRVESSTAPLVVKDSSSGWSSNISSINSALVVTPVDICSEDSDSLRAFQIVGYLIIVVKIVVPLILIVLGSIDFAKAAISGDESSTKKAAVNFGMRVLTGIVIFYIPTVLDFFLSLVSGVSDTMAQYQNCTSCVLSPNNESRCNPKELGK